MGPKVLALEPHPLPVYIYKLRFLPPRRIGFGEQGTPESFSDLDPDPQQGAQKLLTLRLEQACAGLPWGISREFASRGRIEG